MLPLSRSLTLSWMAALGVVVLAACLYAERVQPNAVLFAPAIFVGSFVFVAACMGKLWALRIFLFILILGIDMAFRSRDPADMSVDGSVVYRLALWSAALVVGLAHLPASLRYLRSASCLGLLAYLILAVTSATYSSSPLYTLGCAYGYLCLLPFISAVVARLGVKDVLLVALLAAGTHVALSILLWIVAPEIAIWNNWAGNQPRLQGLLGHPFRMAEAASVFLLTGWIMWRERWLPSLGFSLVAGLGVFALVLTQTRSSIAAVALAMFSAGRFRPISTTLLSGIFLGGLLAVNIVPGTLQTIAQGISRSGDADSTLTMTGRTYIWQQSLEMFAERPVLGHGFAATRTLFSEGFVTNHSKAKPPPHAHNVVVQSLVTMGVVGTLFLLVPLIVPIIHSLRHRDGLANPLTWYITVASMASLGPIGAAPRMLTLFWMLTLVMIQLTRAVDNRPIVSIGSLAAARRR